VVMSDDDILARADAWLDADERHCWEGGLIRDLAAALRELRSHYIAAGSYRIAYEKCAARAERAERALADAQKDTEALAYGRNAALKREAEARGQVRDLAIIIDRMERFAWSSEVVKEEADRARATLAGRPARADEGLMPIKRMLTDEQFCRAFCSPRMDGKHVEECTRAEPRPAPACGHGYVRFSDGSCIPCHVEERARADPRPARVREALDRINEKYGPRLATLDDAEPPAPRATCTCGNPDKVGKHNWTGKPCPAAGRGGGR